MPTENNEKNLKQQTNPSAASKKASKSSQTSAQADKSKATRTNKTGKPQAPAKGVQPPFQSAPPRQKNILLWMCALAALVLAGGTAWYVYTQQQFAQDTKQAEKDLYLAKIDSIATRQKDIAEDIANRQSRFEEQTTRQIEQAIVLLKHDFGQIPEQLSKVFIQQLITQAQLLRVSSANKKIIIQLLNEARRLSKEHNKGQYDNLLAAIEKDITKLETAEDEQTLPSVLARLESLSEQIEALEFSPLGKQQGENLSPNIEIDPSADFFTQFGQQIGNTLSNLVVIRKHDNGISVNLNVDQFHSTKLLIESSISRAKLLLTLNSQEAFKEQLLQASDLVKQHLALYPVEKIEEELRKISRFTTKLPGDLESYLTLQKLAE